VLNDGLAIQISGYGYSCVTSRAADRDKAACDRLKQDQISLNEALTPKAKSGFICAPFIGKNLCTQF
jgi:hypothetical protein